MCADDWWDAQQDDLLLFDGDESDGCADELLSPDWWRRPWPVYRESAHAVTLPDIATWASA